MNKRIFFKFFAVIAIALSGFAASFAQSGGDFAIEQSVIAAGGGTSTDTANNVYTLEGTAGQPATGAASSGPEFIMRSGFWQPLLAPTAAGATVSGRVMQDNGAGIRNVTVTLSGGTLTAPRIVKTNNFGNFRFENVETGQFYVVTVAHNKYGFAQSTQAISLMEDLTDLVFRADWEN